MTPLVRRNACRMAQSDTLLRDVALRPFNSPSLLFKSSAIQCSTFYQADLLIDQLDEGPDGFNYF